MIADFNNNGSGNIIINNFNSSPIYLVNNGGGDSIEFELRSKTNYYALGAKVYVKSLLYNQVREVTTGGVWNSFMPSRLHFGMTSDDHIKQVIIEWPNGEKEVRTDFKKNFLYYIYQ
jgi:hypothetical protein